MSTPTPDERSRPTPFGRTRNAIDGHRDAGVGSDALTSEARVVLRPIASPLPLAFAAFGIGSLVTGVQQVGGMPVSDQMKVNLLLCVFLAPLQLLAAFYAFSARETLAATGLSLLALNWPAVVVVSLGLPAGATSPVLGTFYLGLGGVLLLLASPGFVGKPLLGALMVIAGARFTVAGLYELLDVTMLERVAGVLGLVIAGIGAYGALALGLEDTMHHTVLPVGRRGEARAAFEGDLGTQTATLLHEAGVRRQL